jgi:transcriptional regulator with XRE-family HTH domain
MIKTKITDGKRAQKLRIKLGLRQDQFWSRVGVTQSAGSRYETGSRRLPVPLQMLIELAYGSKSNDALKRLRA